MRRALLLCTLGLLAISCAHRAPNLPYSATFTPGPASAEFLLEYNEADFSVVPNMHEALRYGVDMVRRWGDFQRPVTIKIYPDHEGLELAVNRRNYPWLRAWARYENVFLQSPRTWGGQSYLSRLKELLAHELTHVIMYQRSGNSETWRYKGIPIWFREGMASVTAKQGYRRLKLAEISERLQKRDGDIAIFARGSTLYRDEPELVYSAAHHLFAHLLETREEAGILSIMRAMAGGQRFAQAFRGVAKQGAEKFADEWLKTVAKPAPAVGAAGNALREALLASLLEDSEPGAAEGAAQKSAPPAGKEKQKIIIPAVDLEDGIPERVADRLLGATLRELLQRQIVPMANDTLARALGPEESRRLKRCKKARCFAKRGAAAGAAQVLRLAIKRKGARFQFTFRVISVEAQKQLRALGIESLGGRLAVDSAASRVLTRLYGPIVRRQMKRLEPVAQKPERRYGPYPWLTLGLGAAAAGTAGYFLSEKLDRDDALKREIATGQARSRDTRSAVDDSRRDGTAAAALFGIAGAAALATIALLIFPPLPPETPQADPWEGGEPPAKPASSIQLRPGPTGLELRF